MAIEIMRNTLLVLLAVLLALAVHGRRDSHFVNDEPLLDEETTTTTTAYPATTHFDRGTNVIKINTVSGRFHYPSKGDYSNYEDIAWQINAPTSNDALDVWISYVDIQSCCDFIYIYDGPDPSYPLLAKIGDQSYKNLHVETTQRSAYVRFTSDGSIVAGGFTLTWETWFNFTTAAPTATATAQHITVTEPAVTKHMTILNQCKGIIRHPRNGGNYGPNQRFSWQINADAGTRIAMHFKRIYFEPFCSDYVTLVDGPDDSFREIDRICDNNDVKRDYYTTGNRALIHFSSDLYNQRTGFEMFFSCETFLTTTATPTEQPLDNPWARGRNLIGFWPLDANHRMRDVTGKQTACPYCNGILNENEAGPFGQLGTSYRTPERHGPIINYISVLPFNSKSFSVTLFVRAPMKNAIGPLFTLGDLSMEPYFEIYLTNETEGRPMILIRGKEEIYGTYDVLQPDEWSFFGVVLEQSASATCMLSIHGRFGTLYTESYKPKICEGFANYRQLNLGFSRNREEKLSRDVSMSCLMLYSASILPSDIRAAYHACRAAHGTSPCGSPKLPFPAIPLQTSTQPKHGQFPWMASLMKTSDMSMVRCSAAIIDRFFLLTTANCFQKGETPEDFVVKVGEFDVKISEKQERSHQVRRFTAFPSDGEISGDIALVELATPVDYSSQYVSSVCLPDFELRFPPLSKSAVYYFYGWGKNGRTSVVSESLPRYVTGRLVDDDRCLEAFPTEFRSDLMACFLPSTEDFRNVPCNSDEGGPLMVHDRDILGNDLLRPVGIYTKRSENCDPSKPALFTLIAPYMRWVAASVACALPGHFYPASCPINTT